MIRENFWGKCNSKRRIHKGGDRDFLEISGYQYDQGIWPQRKEGRKSNHMFKPTYSAAKTLTTPLHS